MAEQARLSEANGLCQSGMRPLPESMELSSMEHLEGQRHEARNNNGESHNESGPTGHGP